MAILLQEIGPAMASEAQKRILRVSFGNTQALNESYAKLEQKYNCLASNWDWFINQAVSESRENPKLLTRIDQN